MPSNMPLKSSVKCAVTNREVWPASMFNEPELKLIESNDGGVLSADNLRPYFGF
jgi:hypothetical protein